MDQYTIGIDFGTLSTRAVVVNVHDGKVLSYADAPYSHGVISSALPTGESLPSGWALQHPEDYLNCMGLAVREVMHKSGISADKVIGLGIDFTASTVIPVTADGKPLCLFPEFEHNRNAWVKLWKHHGAEKQAHRLNQVAEQYPGMMKYYGGKFGSEWSLPKLLETLEEAPEIYNAMDQWMEACDWIVWQLTGKCTHSLSAAGVKEMYNIQEEEYMRRDFLKAVDPRLEHYYDEKHRGKPIPLGTCAGILTPAMAERLGLNEGIAVATGNMDGHVAAPILGFDNPEQLIVILGTSGVWLAMSAPGERLEIPGICCGVSDCIYPDIVCYEAGLSCVGDMYQWFADNCVPAEYHHAAENEGKSTQNYLTGLAEKLKPGQSGLIALDWFNGNRSILADSELTGLFIGLTLNTKPEEMYLSLLESSAYAGRVIVENYRDHGIPVKNLIMTGGISRKNSLAMQIYADVLNMPVHIAGSDNGPGHGAALYATVAAGVYSSVFDAAKAMKQPFFKTFEPIPEHVAVYEKLFRQYQKLYRFFGTENLIMKDLLAIKRGSEMVED